MNIVFVSCAAIYTTTSKPRSFDIGCCLKEESEEGPKSWETGRQNACIHFDTIQILVEQDTADFVRNPTRSISEMNNHCVKVSRGLMIEFEKLYKNGSRSLKRLLRRTSLTIDAAQALYSTISKCKNM